MYGAFPKFLREYVQEKHLLTLEEAVHKMTQMPAERMKLRQRGALLPGYAADLLLFNEKDFRDLATYTDPARLAVGMEYMWIGGQPAMREGQILRRDLGQLL